MEGLDSMILFVMFVVAEKESEGRILPLSFLEDFLFSASLFKPLEPDTFKVLQILLALW